MDGTALTEIAPGLWTRPDQVMAIRTTRWHTHYNLTSKPSVTLHIAGCGNDIGWEFETYEDAVAWAGGIAAKINAALQGSARPG